MFNDNDAAIRLTALTMVADLPLKNMKPSEAMELTKEVYEWLKEAGDAAEVTELAKRTN